MISMIAKERAAAVALGSMSLTNSGNYYVANSTGQQLPITSTVFNTDPGAAAIALNSVIRSAPTNFSDFHPDHSNHRSFQQPHHERESYAEDDDQFNRSKTRPSVDDMDEDEAYLMIPGDEKFAAFRQMAMNGKMANKVCRVCGDRALGYNFNVVSCESCKAFFRRNALKKKEFRCPFNDNCDVTALSRRFCQKCRLRKCFEVGMKKEWIMSEEQRIQKRKRIEENRQKRRVVVEKGTEEEMKTEPQQEEITLTDEEPPQSTATSRAGQHFTNAGFSPGVDSPTPEAAVLGNDFSPPDSNEPSHQRNFDGQTHLAPTPTTVTVLHSPRSVNTGNPMSDNRTNAKNSVEGLSDQKNTGVPNRSVGVIRAPKSEPFQSLNSCVDNNTRSPCKTEYGSSGFSSQRLFSPLELKTSNTVGIPFEAPCTIEQPEPEADEATITIPKAVLINLINECHAKQREFLAASTDETVAPVVARAHRLYTDDAMTEHELYRCICRCTCGAKVAGSCIGPRLVDKCIGPEDDVPAPTDNESRNEITEEPTELGGQQEIATSSGELSMDIVESRRSFTEKTDASGLTCLDELKFRELFFANLVIDEPEKNDGTSEINQDPQTYAAGSSQTPSADDPIVGQSNGESSSQIDPTDVIHMTDVCVRRIIKMCKRLSAFKSLCQEDQIALLKGGCTELMILRGVMTFIPAKDCWRPVGWKNSLLSLDVLKGVKGNVYEEHKRYLHSFRDEWRTCDPIMLCLAAITLFNPQRPNIVHVDAVQMEQELYISLLKRYLDMMYGYGTMASDEAFQELLNRVTAVGRLNDYAATIFVDVNPRDVEPLLIEIFDLK